MIADMNQPKFALVIAGKPPKPKYHPSKGTVAGLEIWQRFQQNTPKTSDTTKGIEMLSENAWQIRLDTGMIELSKILLAADEGGIATHVLFLDDSQVRLEYPEHDPR